MQFSGPNGRYLGATSCVVAPDGTTVFEWGRGRDRSVVEAARDTQIAMSVGSVGAKGLKPGY